MTPGLLFILTKHAAELQPAPKQQEMLDQHFSAHEPSRWRDFRRAVRSKTFVKALSTDERADDKLKRYAEGMNLHYADKSGESFTVPGHKKNHTVKYHAKVDRFSCSCPDWGYTKSHQTNKEAQDCKHIKMVKIELQQRGEKVAALNIPRGALGNLNTLYQTDKMNTQTAKSRAVTRAYKEQMPQMTGQGVGLSDIVTGAFTHRFFKHAMVRGLAAQKLRKTLGT
jgi:hypothetical protein